MAWDTGELISQESYARLRAHAGYPRAVRWLAKTMLETADANPAMDGVFKDAGRKVAALCVVLLHFTGGITLPRLKELMRQLRLASPGRARALLIYMGYLGFVELRPIRAAGSPSLYLPTDKFLRIYAAHLRQVVEATAMISPAATEVAEAFDDLHAFPVFVRHLAQGFLNSTAQGHNVDNYFEVFCHRHAGAQILNQLVSDAPGASFPPIGPVPFATAAAARRFRVSRAHIRRLFGAGQQARLIECDAGTVRFTDAGRDMVEWVFASKMIVYLGAVARTFRDVREDPVARHAGIAA